MLAASVLNAFIILCLMLLISVVDTGAAFERFWKALERNRVVTDFKLMLQYMSPVAWN
jgi:ABC-type sulfate transport system permease component